ncbi:restriction endonuclease subunit S [Dysosmobacter sp. Marseille-Q4140]|nr:restriction endonuclease subunit S [Dysosmobacter sp. Marseille-Q4140]
MARLGDVCEKRVDTIKATYEGDIDYIDISSVDNQRKEITQTQSMSIVDAPSRAKQLVFPGDILVSTVRPNLNAVALVTENSDNTLVASTGYCVLRCLPNVNNKYVFYFCQSPDFIEKMVAQATGASYPAVTSAIVKECTIPLPPLEEQRRIAAQLDKVSDLIAKRRAQLDKLDLLVKARFVEMFGDQYTNPKGWETGRIRDVVREVKYGTSRPAVEGGAYKYLRMGNITFDGHLDLSDLKYINIPESEIEKCIVKRGDVLFNRTNSKELVGKTCVFDLDEPMVIAGYIIRVRVNDKVLPDYLSAVLNSQYGKKTLADMCKAIVGQANINAQELQNITILIPPIQLQREFSLFVDQVKKLAANIDHSLEKLEILKKALMQKYFR